VGKAMQRRGPGRDRASVDGPAVWRQQGAGQILQHGVHFALHGMVGLPVADVIDATRAGDGEKARMLARAVVVQRRRGAGPRQRVGRGLRERPMRPAAERRWLESRLRQDARDTFDVRPLTTVRGAGQRKLLVAQPVALGSARFHERQGLQGLDRRTREHLRRHVADAENERSAGIGDGDRAPMAAFHQIAANDFDENRVVHCSSGRVAGRYYRPFMRRAGFSAASAASSSGNSPAILAHWSRTRIASRNAATSSAWV
jgi:hypothetical protein